MREQDFARGGELGERVASGVVGGLPLQLPFDVDAEHVPVLVVQPLGEDVVRVGRRDHTARFIVGEGLLGPTGRRRPDDPVVVVVLPGVRTLLPVGRLDHLHEESVLVVG